MKVPRSHLPSPALGVALVALFVALGGTAGAMATKVPPFAGTGLSPEAHAYALVDPNGGSPRLVREHTSGFAAVAVGPFGPGDYCLTPVPGVDVARRAAVASEEAFYSNAAGFVTVRYPTSGPSCAPNQLEVKTFDQSVQLSTQIGFTVSVG